MTKNRNEKHIYGYQNLLKI